MRKSFLPWAILSLTAYVGCSGDDGTNNTVSNSTTATTSTVAASTSTGTGGIVATTDSNGSLIATGGTGTGTDTAGTSTSTSTGGIGATGGTGGTTAATTTGTGGSTLVNTTSARACDYASATIISDFEDGTGSMNPALTSNGMWYVYADALSGSQTPVSAASAITASTLDTADQATCNLYGMHSTATGHTSYVGFGASFHAGSGTRSAFDVSAYDGLTFKIKAGSGQGSTPVFFEILTKENQPSPDGTATCDNADKYNSRGVLLENVSTSWTQVYVPFKMMGARYLPAKGTLTTCKYEAPAFVSTNVLGFQYSTYPDFTTAGAYDLWIDDMAFYTGDSGLTTLTQTSTGAYQFPRDKTFSGCAKPTGAAGKYIVDAYNMWKETFVTTASSGSRVKSPEAISGLTDATVSEGIAYGMLIAVYMNDQTLFDSLLTYWKAHPVDSSRYMLMNWLIDSSGNTSGSGSATDADEDAAFALIMASRQWTGTDYSSDVSAILSQIWANDVAVDSSTSTPYLKPGSNFGGKDLTNPSYFAPAYYKVFAEKDSNNWSGLISSVYSELASISGSYGLVPAWCMSTCTTVGANGAYSNDTMYQYDSHRAPWRIGLDACWNQNSNALDYVAKTTSFFVGASDTEGLGSLVDIYGTDGTAAGSTIAKANSASLIGAAATGAMALADSDTAAQDFLNRSYQFVLDVYYSPSPTIKTGTTKSFTYYNATVGLLSLLTMTGNFTVLE